MKPKYKYSLIICFLMLMSSCGEDFISLAPIDQPNAENFFKSANDFDLAVIGIYDAANERLLEQSGWAMKEMRSDNTEQHQMALGGFAEPFNQINEFYVLADNSLILDHWRGSYYGIARANVVLTRIQDVQMDQSLKNQFIGESLFLRSYFYFNLVRLYGDVPMPLQEYSSPALAFSDGRVPASQIYEQLISDLREAADMLPDTYPDSQKGRATSGAAKALLAKVFLTLGQNGDAEVLLREVIESGLYRLLPDYASLWEVENKNNDESIFELQFLSGGLGEGSAYADAWLPQSAGRDIYGAEYLGNGGQGLNTPTQDLINAYEEGDLRKEISLAESYINASGEIIEDPRILKFSDPPSLPLDSDDNFPVIRYADVLLMLAESLGNTPESWDLIDQIRERAGLAPADRTQNFEEALLQERRVEFAFENHRWFDLLRFGKALDVMQQHIEERKDSTEPYLYNEIGIVTSDKLLFPIPLREIQINDVVDQNSGY